jgi:hypothetical protein
MVRSKSVRYHGWAEGSGRVDAATGVVDTHKLGDEERLYQISTANLTPSELELASPIPTGAMKVPSCFSVASMKIVKTNCAVKNICELG